jgi:hypothetical protein
MRKKHTKNRWNVDKERRKAIENKEESGYLSGLIASEALFAAIKVPPWRRFHVLDAGQTEKRGVL